MVISVVFGILFIVVILLMFIVSVLWLINVVGVFLDWKCILLSSMFVYINSCEVVGELSVLI